MPWIRASRSRRACDLTGGANDPQLVGPEQWWRAQDVPGCTSVPLSARAAIAPRSSGASLTRVLAGTAISLFPIKPDGEFHTYELDLSSVPGYQGTITGLRLDPTDSIAAGEEVRVAFLSWKPNSRSLALPRELISIASPPMIVSCQPGWSTPSSRRFHTNEHAQRD